MSNGGRRSRRSAARWRLSPATPLQPRKESWLATPHKIKLTTYEFRPLLSAFAGSRSSVLRGRPLEPYRLPVKARTAVVTRARVVAATAVVATLAAAKVVEARALEVSSVSENNLRFGGRSLKNASAEDYSQDGYVGS